MFCYAGKKKSFCKTEYQSLYNIHPFAFYYLTGGDYNISDIQSAAISINASKLKVANCSQETSGMKLYKRNYKRREFIGFSKSYGDLGTESFDFSVYKRLKAPNSFIIDCTCNGGGSCTFIYHLFIRKQRKNYYDSGKIKLIDVLTCDGDFGKQAPSEKEIEKVEKVIKQKSPVKKAKALDKEFKDIHPYAFYYLSGGDNRLKGTERSIMGINASKFKLNVKSNEISGKIVWTKDNKTGFTYDLDSLDKEDKYLEKDNFYITIYKKLGASNYYIVKCVFTRGSNTPQVNYILVKKHYKYYYSLNKFQTIEVLTCDGDFGKQAPSEKEIEKVIKLIAQESIGDI